MDIFKNPKSNFDQNTPDGKKHAQAIAMTLPV